jgi:glucuronosyltransferase
MDQPVSGLDKTIWWIEHVIRHKGAKHLRSPTVDMSWSAYFLLDVTFVAVLFGGVVSCIVILCVKTVKTLIIMNRIPRNKN